MVDFSFEFTFSAYEPQHMFHLSRSLCAMCFEPGRDPGLHRHRRFELRAPMCRVRGEELAVRSAGDGRV